MNRQRMEQEFTLLREIRIRKARKDFWEYCKLRAPDFYKETRWHLKMIAMTLQALYEKRLTKAYFLQLCNETCPQWFVDTVDWDRLRDGIVYEKMQMSIPPRMGKSRTLVMFCAWMFGEDATNRVITASYNDDQATEFSRFTRDEISEERVYPHEVLYEDIFPATRISDDNASFKKWALDGQFFSYKGAGIGGSVTGKGGNCFPAGTIVQTERGPMDIAKLHQMKNPPPVLSYDHSTGKIVYRSIIASRRVFANDFTEIETSCGRKIVATDEHRIFDSERGYKQARDFVRGNRLITAEIPFEQNVRNVSEEEGRPRGIVYGVLQQGAQSGDRVEMCLLHQRIPQAALRVRKSDQQTRNQGLLLFEGVQSGASCGEEQQTMSCLRWQEEGQTHDLLFPTMSKNSESKNAHSDQLPSMRGRVSTEIEPNNVLQPNMCGQSAFGTHEGNGEFPLQRRNELQRVVQTDAASDFGTGQPSMCDVRGKGTNARNKMAGEDRGAFEYAHPSHQRGCDQQHIGEPCDTVRGLPYEAPQVQGDTVSSTRRIRRKRIAVYDIQVEGTSNFFANGILVHNCLIVDDPVKDAEEAFNEPRLDKIWLWYTGTFLSRQEQRDNSIMIVNMTRWSKNDVCGRLLDGPEGHEWFVLQMEAFYEYDSGVMLCEELLNRRRYESLKIQANELIFMANYHQKPVDMQGRLYKDFKYYEHFPADEYGSPLWEKIISYTDTADEGSDYLCSLIAGVYLGELYILDVVYTKDGMEITEPLLAERLVKSNCTTAKIESNNGGRSFARSVERIMWDSHQTRKVHVEWFHQSKNKRSRIMTNSVYVMQHVYYPADWRFRWPDYYKAMTEYSKEGKNKHDDAPDATTGLVEMMDYTPQIIEKPLTVTYADLQDGGGLFDQLV